MKKKLIILISTLFIVLALVSSVFAYFYLQSNEKQVNVTINNTTDNVLVTSFENLERYSKSEVYNTHNISESTSKNRKTLVLQNDIIVTHNLVYTSHVNFDLNGHTLYLNGYMITINNINHGDFMFFSNKANGVVVVNQVVDNDGVLEEVTNGTSGKINIYVPNQTIMNFANVTFKTFDGTVLDSSLYAKVLEDNDKLIAYNALAMVAESLLKQYDSRSDYPDLSTLNTNTNITGNGPYTFNSLMYLAKRDVDNTSTCAFSNTPHACSFITGSLDLPLYYGNDDSIKIKYSSSNTNILSNFGIYQAPSATTDLTLTASVYRDEELIATCDFLIHALVGTEDIINGAYTALLSRIEYHYNSTEQLYSFNKEISLPSDALGCTFEYYPYKDSSANEPGSVDLWGNGTYYYTLGESNVRQENGLSIFSPTSETTALHIVISKNNISREFNIHMKSENLIVNSETSIVRDLLNEWYGGTINITKTDELNNIYNSVLLKTTLTADEQIKYPNITSISYELVNDIHNLYGIDNNELHVISGKVPEAYVQDVMLGVNATIKGKNINIQMNIKIITEAGDQASSFLPYYTYYDEYIKSTYNNYITKTFELPFAYSSNGPVILYDFVIIPDDYDKLANKAFSTVNPSSTNMFKVSLYYNKAIRNTFTFTEGTSYKEAFNALYDQASILNILSYNDAKWVFDYDISASKNYNQKIGLVYNYKFSPTASGWTTYKTTDDEQIVSKITLVGVLHLNTDVTDESFYKWIYDNFTTDADLNNNKLTYTIGDYTSALSDSLSGKYVLIDWLSQDIHVDVINDSSLSTINDFTGLKYLVGTTYLDLTGKLTNGSQAINTCREISKMNSLETLILANNTSITDGFVNNEPVDNDSISRFINLKKLKKLDLSGCNIYSFEFMNDMTWLTSAYLHSQSVSSNNNLNNFYGNTGIANFSTFGNLTDSGVKVYTSTTGSDPLLFEKQYTVNDYTRLKNIIHQNKLIEGADITKLYETFSTNPLDYRLEKSYSYQTGSGTLSVDQANTTLTWNYVDYSLTKDTEINQSKTYYIKNGTNYTEVATPTVDDIGFYYEHMTPQTAMAYKVTYHIAFSNSTFVNLVVTFEIERYAR
ncbi:MAG: hypothetical protein K6G28_04335 [Acholeplasmatales bacterium]|nr:hypothetical protein [Acholeplasmatales bacterium]